MIGPGTRILLTTDAVGGVWTYGLDLARGLGRHGVETTLAVLGPPPAPDAVAEAEAVPALALELTGLPLDWLAATPNDILEAGQALAALAADVRADLVHLHSPAYAAGAPFTVPVVGSCHSCVATWWASVRGTALPADLAWRADLTGRGCRAAEALIAPSRSFAAATVAAYGLRASPAAIRNGRDPSGAPLPVSAAEPFAFTAGRLWDEGKNAAVLDAAAAGLGMTVLAAGPLAGPNGARIDVRHVRALGRLTPAEVAQHLAAQPVFVSTALYEPFGLAVLEAAGFGCPLVLSDIPTFRELWEDAALFVDARDPAAVAAALRRLRGSADERRRLGERARSRAADYGAERFVAGTLAVYRDVLRARPDGDPGHLRREIAA